MIKLGYDESLPKGWSWTKANDVMDVRDGTHDSPKVLANGVPLVTSKNLINGKIDFSSCTYISQEDHKKISKRSAVDDGDILYAMIGTIGNPVIVEKNFDFSIKNVALFKFTKSDIYNRYVYHYLNSGLAIQQFKSNSRGGTQKFVSLGNIRELIIPLPPLEEQKRIAAILDKADSIRRKRQQAIQLADDFLRAVFLDMFGDPVTNPKGWQVKSISSVSKQVTVGLVIRPASYYVDVGVPAIRSLNVKVTGIYENNFVYFSQEDNEGVLSKSRVFTGDIVIVRSGQPGKSAVIPKHLDGVNAIDVLIMRPDIEQIDSDYFSYFMNSGAGKNLVMTEERGQVQKHLNVGSLNAAIVPIPPLNLQKKFIHLFFKVRKNFGILSDDNQENLFSALSQKAFSGEL